ncbi:interferon alpha-inducible protein 27-like protein 2A isoform X1 [Erpetoichthys calabaricus]|uniref:interferon alpha-inducible protein 27-like protein 2A isoform X1 n=1 Tax=Erpetoichthys calabaricus TaxID=27687 RepID=UPI00109FB573|nr:interferon alpha-inducible protein 27-like protein 2A isoform X1 [Erpetoichthys calabaricus]
MYQKTTAVLFIILIITFQGEGKSSSEDEGGSLFNYALLIGGAVAGVVAAPVVLGLAGFTSAGIAAGSAGASLMSTSAIVNGGGVAAGGLVATLQSAGTGLGLAGKAVAAAIGSATTYAVGKKNSKDEH